MGISPYTRFECPQCHKEIMIDSFWDHLSHMLYTCPERKEEKDGTIKEA